MLQQTKQTEFEAVELWNYVSGNTTVCEQFESRSRLAPADREQMFSWVRLICLRAEQVHSKLMKLLSGRVIIPFVILHWASVWFGAGAAAHVSNYLSASASVEFSDKVGEPDENLSGKRDLYLRWELRGETWRLRCSKYTFYGAQMYTFPGAVHP